MKKNKSQIIQVTEQLTRQRGYDGVSIRDVADAVGLQKSSIYSHFKSKDELINEVLVEMLESLSKKLTLTGDCIADFHRILIDVADYLKTEKKCLGLQLLYNSGPNAEQIKTNIYRFFYTLKEGLIAALAQNDILKNINTSEIVEDIISQIEGATLWVLLDENSQALDRAVNTGLKTIEQLLTTQTKVKH